jgi:predicted nucleic acid-binding Zn ribbon protein
VFEAFQKMTTPPLTKCKECGAKGSVSRLVGAGAGLIFKGSGFYATDYKRSGAKAETGEKKFDATEKKSDATEKKPDAAEKPPEKSEKKEKSETAKSKTSSPPDKS